ncbi:MAG: hypothetical protein JW819_06740 [Candidatus Krumholzibacteriota bacterium]|nr:hypothetical protein [Candidatus Krumholzibacteriota bacterium]
MNRSLIALALLLPLAAFLGCSEDTTGAGGGVDNPDSAAAYWFQALGDTVQHMGEAMDAGDTDYLRDLDFSAIRAGFQEVIATESMHSLAHVGMGLVELLEVNYDPDIWDMIDSILASEGRDGGPAPLAHPLRGRLLGREWAILAEAPLTLADASRSLPGNVTIANMQAIIHGGILPKVSQAITHFDLAEIDPDFSHHYVVDGDTCEADRGELYFTGAALRALRGGLRMMIGYDMDLAGADGTYDWLDADEWEMTWEVLDGPVETGDTLRYHSTYIEDEVRVIRNLRHLLTDPGSTFLTLNTDDWSGESMLSLARSDMLAMIGKLDLARTAILAEADEQDDDLIKIGMLEDLDAEVGGIVDGPAFAQAWEGLDDVIAWADSLFRHPMTFTDDMGTGPFTITVNLSVLFTDPVADWKTMLPLHEWNDEAEWVDEYADPSEQPWNPEAEYWLMTPDGWEHFFGIGWVDGLEEETWMAGEPVTFLDNQGGSINPDVVLPFMPDDDYTFAGLFPGMTRGDWIDLLGYGD